MAKRLSTSLALLTLLTLGGCDRHAHHDAENAETASQAVPAATRGGGDVQATPAHMSLLAGASAAPKTPIEAILSASDTAASDARQTALAAAIPMAVNAATGGVYRSADGQLVVQIPPGALTRDATVRFARLDTSTLPDGPVGTPGIVVVEDWGGATFQPDGSVTVKARVDDRFMHSLAVGAPNTDPTTLGLSREGQAWYLPVVARPDDAGRPESVMQTKVGSGSLVEVASLPVDPARVAPAAIAAREPDVLPRAAVGIPTLSTKGTDDPLVARYPALPVALSSREDYHPVETLDSIDGKTTIPVRRTLSQTIAGVPSMLACTYDPCRGNPAGPLVAAQRFNKALEANRQPPDALRDRVRKLIDVKCPDNYSRATRGQLKR